MKERIYQIEEQFLSPYAKKSRDASGRVRPIEPCPLRTEFIRDRDKIVHSKSFRRLKHKTQVFLSPEGDHYRTRLTHTLEVSQIARTISRALSLNEDLTEAIALGHDLGHTPFGHAGERTLNALTGHFKHNEQSLRVVELLENDGEGLNLTAEVRDGIVNHTKSGKPSTLEGAVVSISDRIAYINHDIDDAIRAGILTEKDIPIKYSFVLGKGKSERINTLISDVVSSSMGKDHICQSEEAGEAMNELRSYLFATLYTGSIAKTEETKAQTMIELMFDRFKHNLELLPDFFRNLLNYYPEETVISDYIAGMTDTFAVKTFEALFVPGSWKTDNL